MSAPFTLAEELAPVLQQIVALDIFLRCAKEEQDTILADQEQLQREIYANRKTSEVILSSWIVLVSVPADVAVSRPPLTRIHSEEIGKAVHQVNPVLSM